MEKPTAIELRVALASLEAALPECETDDRAWRTQELRDTLAKLVSQLPRCNGRAWLPSGAECARPGLRCFDNLADPAVLPVGGVYCDEHVALADVDRLYKDLPYAAAVRNGLELLERAK